MPEHSDLACAGHGDQEGETCEQVVERATKRKRSSSDDLEGEFKG